jgi:predicted transcriptional regulator of viral defense system
MTNKLTDFFYKKTVFSREEILDAIPEYRSKKQSLSTLLSYHVKKGNLISIKQNLYGVVPRGYQPEEAASGLDPFLLASKLTSDAVIGYHSALDFYGWLHSARFEIVYLTQKNLAKTRIDFGGNTYQSTKVPEVLCRKNSVNTEVRKEWSLGEQIKVTSPERTFVDVLSRPALLGHDWEEISRSLEKVHIARPSAIIAYLKCLGSSSIASRVGYFLDRRENKNEGLVVAIDEIKTFASHSIANLDTYYKSGNILVKKWNLLVPKNVYNSSWEEIH